MLNIFLSGQGQKVVILPIIVLIFGVTSIVNANLIVDSPSYIFTSLDSYWLDWPYLKLVFGILLLSIIAFYINRIFNSNNFYKNVNSLPSLFFIMLAFAWSGFHFFSPLMISLLFLLMSINKLLKVYHQKNIISEVFDAGFYLGMAALFYYPMALFIISIWINISFNRAFNYREYLFPIIGLILPFFFLSVFFFTLDLPYDFLEFGESETVRSLINYGSLTQRIFVVISTLALVIALPFFIKENNRVKVKTKNMGRFILILLFNAILIYFLSFSFFPIHNRELILFLPAVFIIPFYFFSVGNLYKNLLFYFWLSASILFNIWPNF